jgi:hypothetical protein
MVSRTDDNIFFLIFANGWPSMFLPILFFGSFLILSTITSSTTSPSFFWFPLAAAIDATCFIAIRIIIMKSTSAKSKRIFIPLTFGLILFQPLVPFLFVIASFPHQKYYKSGRVGQ